MIDKNKPILIDGKEVLYHVEINPQSLGLTEKECLYQDMAKEYAVVSDPEANAGIIVYAKYHNEWSANPWSTRFLIRDLLEKIKDHDRQE